LIRGPTGQRDIMQAYSELLPDQQPYHVFMSHARQQKRNVQKYNVVDNVRARFGTDHPQLKVFLDEHTIMQPGDMALDHIWEACESSLVGEAPRMHAQLSASRMAVQAL
jgi:hypothetical protein